jgi:hypothetical protein
MAVLLSPVGGVAGQFFDNNGNPLTGGKLYSYVAGTTTPQATYTSSAGTVAHSNPIILDAGGRVPGGEIWLTDGLQYKFVLKNATDVLIGTYDNIIGINSNFVNFLTETEVQTATASQTVFTLTTMQYQPGTNNLTVYVDGVNQIDGSTYSYVETSSTVITFTAGLHVGALVKFTTAQTLSTGVTDASLVTYTPAGTGAVPTTVQAKLRQYVSPLDFGAVGNGTINDTAAILAAIATGKPVNLCGLTYLIDGSGLLSNASIIDITTPTIIYGEGGGFNIKVPISSASNITAFNIQNSFYASDTSFTMVQSTAGTQLAPQNIFSLVTTTSFQLNNCKLNGSALAFDANNIYCYGIKVDGAASISGVVVQDCSFLGLLYGFVSMVTFTGVADGMRFIGANSFQNISGDALEFNAPNGTMVNILVDSARITNLIALPSITAAGFGIGVAKCINVTITNCYVDTTYIEGVHIEDLSSSVTVENNHLQSKYGVVLYAPLTGGLVDKAYGRVIICDNIIVGPLAVTLGSSMNGYTPAPIATASVGIALPSAGAFETANYVTIENNCITGFDIGIRVPQSKGCLVTGNNIVNCIVALYSDDPQYNYENRINNNKVSFCKYFVQGQRIVVGSHDLESVNNLFLKIGAIGSIFFTSGFSISTAVTSVTGGTVGSLDLCTAPTQFYDPCVSFATQVINTTISTPTDVAYQSYTLNINGAVITPSLQSTYGYGTAVLDGTPLTITAGRLLVNIANSGATRNFKVLMTAHGSFVYAY